MRIFIIFILTSLLAACSSNTRMGPYRTDLSICDYTSPGSCTDNMLMQSSQHNYHLGFIEYDDQGQLYYPDSQITPGNHGVGLIFDKYREIAREKPVFLIVYTHGWDHNANGAQGVFRKQEDSNITQFRKVLAVAAENEARRPPEERREVLGVYMSWRGKSLLKPLHYGTFWGRKETAHEVGYIGMADELLKLEQITRLGTPEKNRMVTIGHSFGGAAVFSALQGVLSERYVGSRDAENPKHKVVEGFGDMVILMNPAFEAIRYGSLFDTAQDGCREYPQDQPPRLVILSSSGDGAVRRTFRLGRFFSTLFESHRKATTTVCGPNGNSEYQVREWPADKIAVGHYLPYSTHRLTLIEDGKLVAKRSQVMPEIASLALDKVTSDWEAGLDQGALRIDNVLLTSEGVTRSGNPYMNVFTDKFVIEDHGDVWNDNVIAFINKLLERAAK